MIGRFVTKSVPSFLHKSRYKLKLEAYVADLIPISDISRLQALWLAEIGFRKKIGRIITAFVAIYLGKSYFFNLITFNPGVKTAHKPTFLQGQYYILPKNNVYDQNYARMSEKIDKPNGTEGVN